MIFWTKYLMFLNTISKQKNRFEFYYFAGFRGKVVIESNKSSNNDQFIRLAEIYGGNPAGFKTILIQNFNNFFSLQLWKSYLMSERVYGMVQFEYLLITATLDRQIYIKIHILHCAWM